MSKIELTVTAIAMLVFIGLSALNFYQDEEIVGVLWLILAEIYNIRFLISKIYGGSERCTQH